MIEMISENLLTLKDISTSGAEEQHQLSLAAGQALWKFVLNFHCFHCTRGGIICISVVPRLGNLGIYSTAQKI